LYIGCEITMELTNDQTLQQAVEAHKAGKLREAEALYQAILQAQPKHPDANHNLGVLAVSLNKEELALPLFKTALEANPNQGQFWLSYLDALIKTNQLEIAKSVLEQGKKLGLAGERVEAFQAQLSPMRSPSNDEVNGLLEHYQNGRYDLAENLAKTITQKYTDHQFSWKVLGAVFQLTGRLQESLLANERAVAILPNDAEAHFNLGNTRQDLGRQEEAEASYRKAIAINPEYAQAHSNLGNTMQKLGSLKEAEESYRNAIAINPDLAEVHSNMGLTLQKLGRLEEAEESYRKAIAIKPDLAEAHFNLGNTLQDLGSLAEAESSYRKAITIKPDLAEIHSNLGNTLKELGRLEEAEESYRKAITIKPEYVEAQSNLGNTLQDLGRLKEAEECYRNAIAIKPDLAEIHSNLGTTLQELGRLEEAEESYRKAISLKPDHEATQYNLGIWYCEHGKYKEAAEQFLKSKNFKNNRSYLLKCWYFLNEQSLFYEQLESLTSQGITDATIGSFGCRAKIKFGIEKVNPFCNSPLNYVFKTDLSKKYDFDETFVQPSLAILNDTKLNNRSQNLLTNGLQTSGNLFALENILIDEVKKIIELEIENYRLYFNDSKEGLIKNWPNAYSLHGWLIRMKNGGALRPHMHEKGWISGSIYINVPPKLNINDGNLVVCIEDDALLSEAQDNKKNIIDVTTGTLCLFPASLLHYTIPFESEEERIVLAFDVVPKSY
jgi:tetratricopeptide (TPR) repeat protein